MNVFFFEIIGVGNVDGLQDELMIPLEMGLKQLQA